eukprot:6476465-Amphidinium_carterae.3
MENSHELVGMFCPVRASRCQRTRDVHVRGNVSEASVEVAATNENGALGSGCQTQLQLRCKLCMYLGGRFTDWRVRVHHEDQVPIEEYCCGENPPSI